jgi:hypothetical protein
MQTFAILKPAGTGEVPMVGLETSLTTSSLGRWTPDSTGLGYGPELEYIQYSTHFAWLKANRPTFTGVEDNPPQYNGTYDTVSAIQKMFVNVGTDAAAMVVAGIDPLEIESLLTNVIATVTDENAKDYNPGWDSRTLFLVLNYNPVTKSADAIGVLTLEWNLTIKDYKQKKNSPVQHSTTLMIKGRSVLYSSLSDMTADYVAAQAHFKQNSFALFDVPSRKTTIKIFDALPPPTKETFLQGLPLRASTNDADVIILYAPNLLNVGSIDNTDSAVTTTYSQSLTSGFTFTTSQTLSITASIEASALVVKVGLTVGFSISFTEAWSSSRTETMSFVVPPGKKAFTYQGYMLAQVLRYSAKTGQYSYTGDAAKCLTNVLTTSENPLVDQS